MSIDERRLILEYEFKSDFFREREARKEAKSKAEGEIRAVLVVLEARGLTVSDAVREQIVSCTDLEQLDAWLRRAATATTPEEVVGS